MMTSIFLTAAVLVGVTPDVPSAKLVQINVRICRGDPKGSVEAGTVKAVAMPSVTTLMNRPGWVFSGAEVAVLCDGNVEYLPVGVRVQVTPRSIDKRTVQVEVEFEDSSRQGAPKLRAAMSGRLLRGEPIRLFLPTAPDEPQVWAEIVVDKPAR